MYDALIPVGPIMVFVFCAPMHILAYASAQLALTAASPIWRGYLSDVDCRWNVIAGSVDDRTAEERGRVVN